MVTEPTWYTTEELASALKVEPREIVALIEAGELEAVSIRGAVRIASNAVDRYLGVTVHQRGRRMSRSK
jgi:excisionase family DNA binding protein